MSPLKQQKSASALRFWSRLTSLATSVSERSLSSIKRDLID